MSSVLSWNLVNMHSSYGILFAGTVLVVCIQWTCTGASLSMRMANNSPAINGSKDCACSPVGSLNTPCDNATTECTCRIGYEGANCTECQNGYFYRDGNRSAECVSCQCNPIGSISMDCDRFVTCSCKPGVGGIQCDQCLSGYYGLSTSGCQKCSCEEAAIKCHNSSKSKDSKVASMCHSCLRNASWISRCINSMCLPSEYLTSAGSCTPCQCRASNVSRHCDLMTGKCPKCEGESCPNEDVPNLSHIRYQVYIIASGAVAGFVIIILVILLAVYCRRRCRRKARRTPLPLWTIELRRDDDDECNTTQELAFDDLDVMYLDDSYLMESSSDYFTESTDSINRTGYHTLS